MISILHVNPRSLSDSNLEYGQLSLIVDFLKIVKLVDM